MEQLLGGHRGERVGGEFLLQLRGGERLAAPAVVVVVGLLLIAVAVAVTVVVVVIFRTQDRCRLIEDLWRRVHVRIAFFRVDAGHCSVRAHTAADGCRKYLDNGKSPVKRSPQKR